MEKYLPFTGCFSFYEQKSCDSNRGAITVSVEVTKVIEKKINI